MSRKLAFSVIIFLLTLADAASAGSLYVPDGSTYTVTGSETYDDFDVAGTLIIDSSGNLTSGDGSILDGSGATITVNGGSLTVNGRFNVGQGSDGYINMNGGTFTVTGTFKFPDNPGGEHRIYLNDGIMHAHDIEQKHDRDAVIYVGAGILRLDDITGLDRDPQDWKDNGDLLPAEGYDDIVIEYIPAGPYTEVRATKHDPNFASNPSPPDGGGVFQTEATLSWSPGENAKRHDVYFGTDFNDVNSANDCNVLPGRGRRDSNSYDVCDLELGKTYYWRIDEVNGPTMWRGNVWRFTMVASYTNSLGMRFIRIPPGTFTMGSGNDPYLEDNGSNDYDEQPAHLVKISQPFYMLETKVADIHYQQAGLGGSAADVSWNDAAAFCEWLSNLEGKKYRLPTEAEWEYVCKNPQGVLDMSSGEWVQDWHRTYINDGQVDPVGPNTGMLKVIRSDSQDRGTLPPDANSSWGLDPTAFRVVLETNSPDVRYVAPLPFTQAAVKQSTAPALEGPDPSIPYFTVRFALPIPPDNTGTVGALTGVCQSVCRHNHSPGFEILPNGDALAVYFSAPHGENDDDVRFIWARLRYGSDQWDMPELFYDFKHRNDQSGLLWTDGGTVYFFGGGRISESDKIPFKICSSTDNGATWQLKLPVISGGIGDYTPQPITNAFKAPNGDVYFAMDGSGTDSFLWRSTDNMVTWTDMGGRTNGRHSTIVPLDDSGTLLSLGGKNSYVGDYYMPQCTSTNWGQSWGNESATVFSWLDGNQRPNVIRLADGTLAFCSDAQHRDGSRPSGATYDRGCIVALSADNGSNWYIKNLPVTLPHESALDDGTLGYSTIRQAPNGIIHILTTMTNPCLHYELNEAWILSDDGDIPPETTGGTVNDYNEYYPGGALRATWSARICTHGRYLLDGKETFYYENGKKEHEVTYNNGRKTGIETYWGPDGVKQWTWNHDDANNTSVWTHWWSNGYKRIESRWNTYPVARDLSRHFSGFVADGDAYHWDRSGAPTHAYSFSNGNYVGQTSLPAAQTRDNIDLATFVHHWLWMGMPGGDGYNEADLNKDGVVNFLDFALFVLQ